MDIEYLCKDCCDVAGIEFVDDAENSVGRKRCVLCDTNMPSRLMTVGADGLIHIAKQLLMKTVLLQDQLTVAQNQLTEKVAKPSAPKSTGKSETQLLAQLDRIEAYTRAMLSGYYGHKAAREALTLIGQPFALLPGEVQVGPLEPQ